MPRNTGTGSDSHMVIWEESFVIFICFQKSEYLGALKYFVYKRGDPPKTEFIYNKLCIYSYMFKLQSLSKYSPFDAIHLLRCFFPLLKTVFELVNFYAF